jgi:hypothetical protein
MKDYKKTGGVLKELKKGSSKLLKTVTKEALHVTQKLSMFLAKGFTLN